MQIVRTAKIVIIENQLIIAADMQLQLQQLGYEVIGIIQSPEAAIETIKKNPPDLVLIDIRLGGDHNGIETAQCIMEEAPCPILFLSYGTNKLIFQKMMQTNPYAVIPKPFQMTDLERGISKALKRIAVEKANASKKIQSEHWTMTGIPPKQNQFNYAWQS